MKKLKSKRRKPLSLSNYRSIGKDLEQLRDDIESKLRPKLFSFDTIQELHYEALKYLSPVNQRVKNNPKSIQAGIEEVLKYLLLLSRSDILICQIS
jgi:hypothetical protein